MVKSWRRRSRYTQAKFRPYAKAIGELALAWNDFHEALGALFIQASWHPPGGSAAWFQASAVWGVITSDRQKRTILEAAISGIGKERHLESPKIAEDVIWLVKRGHDLEDKRNNVIHAPLIELTNALAAALSGEKHGSITPSMALQNTRAIKLRKSLGTAPNLLREIRFCRDYATALATFARDLSKAWAKQRPWPKTPRLPPLKDHK
jgi:hypothetical protein